MHRRCLIAVTLAASLLPGLVAASDVASPEPSAKRFIVFGVDRTDTWERMTHLGLQLAEQTLLHDLRPGDEILYRWISDRSYAADQVFAHVRLPEILRSSGQLDRRGKQAEAASRQALVAAARAGRDQLRGLTSASRVGTSDLSHGTESTDLIGFLAAAGEQFAQAGNGPQRQLILVSDLEDTRHFTAEPDLNGVDVLVYFVSLRADPAMGQRIQQEWTQRFTDFGARSISIRPAVVETGPKP